MKLLTATLLALSVAVAPVAYANDDNDDRIEQQVQNDSQFAKKKQEAVDILKKRGYYKIKKVEADAHEGQPALSMEAYKNGQEYDIKMAYPSLQILREKRDD